MIFLHSAPPLGGPRRNIVIPFGVEKLEWWGYQMVKKFRKYLYVLNERDVPTHRQTPHDSIGRACA